MPGIIKENGGYRIGKESFRRKLEVTERCRGILNSGLLGSMVVGDDLFFLCELLLFHKSYSTKARSGISSITIEQNPVFPSQRGFWIKRMDGTRTDFSFIECISPTPISTAIKSAFRHEIVAQILEFKNEFFGSCTCRTCEITGDAITPQNCHVDHQQPKTFDWLADKFIKENNLEPESIGLMGHEDGRVFEELSDRELGYRWAEFHRANCSLRVVSAKANLSVLTKGTKKKNQPYHA